MAASENGVLAALSSEADFEAYKAQADQSELNFVWLSSDSDPSSCGDAYIAPDEGDESSTCVVMECIDGQWIITKVPSDFDTSGFLCGCIVKFNQTTE